MSPDLFFQYLFAGITYGSIYAVVAIGFNIIYNATGIINFAQGEFVMLGGMIAISLLPLLPLPLAVAAAVAITMAVGGLIEVLFIRWLQSPSVLRMVIITIGISILLRESALHLWGESIRSLPYFYGNEVTTLNLGSVHLSPQVLFVLGACAVMVAGLHLFFRATPVGREMRACAAKSAGSMASVLNCSTLDELPCSSSAMVDSATIWPERSMAMRLHSASASSR